MSKPLRFALLCRVSTAKQEAEGLSLDLQERDGRAYVKRAGGTVAAVFRVQESATKDERPGLERVLRAAEAKQFDALVVRETSRLARNVGVMLAACQRLRNAGVRLHDFNGPVDAETPEGKFAQTVLTAGNEYSATKTSGASQDSRETAMLNGVPAAGRPPFGRRWDGEQYEVIKEKQAQIRKAHELIVKRGWSFNRAAAELGLARSSLRKAIRSCASTEVKQQFRGKRYTFVCPVLLPERMQREMSAAIAANVVVRPRARTLYLLQGLVRCSGCGRVMTGQTSTKNGWRTSVYRHLTGPAYREGCTWQVPVARLDAAVLRACAELVKDGDALRERIRARLTAEQTGLAELEDRRDALKRQVAAAQRELDGQAETGAHLKTEAARKAWAARADRIGKRAERLQAELDELTTRIEAVTMPTANAESIAQQVRQYYWGSGQSRRYVDLSASRLPFAKQRAFVRDVVGRAGRDSAEGIFVSIIRGKTNRDARYTFRLDGMLGTAEGAVGATGGQRGALLKYPRPSERMPVRVDGEIER